MVIATSILMHSYHLNSHTMADSNKIMIMEATKRKLLAMNDIGTNVLESELGTRA
jgi:hypothetical protein